MSGDSATEESLGGAPRIGEMSSELQTAIDRRWREIFGGGQ